MRATVNLSPQMALVALPRRGKVVIRVGCMNVVVEPAVAREMMAAVGVAADVAEEWDA